MPLVDRGVQFNIQLNGMHGRIIKRATTVPIRKVLGSIAVLAELPSVPFTLLEMRDSGCVSLPPNPVSLHGDDVSLPPPCQILMLKLCWLTLLSSKQSGGMSDEPKLG